MAVYPYYSQTRLQSLQMPIQELHRNSQKLTRSLILQRNLTLSFFKCHTNDFSTAGVNCSYASQQAHLFFPPTDIPLTPARSHRFHALSNSNLHPSDQANKRSFLHNLLKMAVYTTSWHQFLPLFTNDYIHAQLPQNHTKYRYQYLPMSVICFCCMSKQHSAADPAGMRRIQPMTMCRCSSSMVTSSPPLHGQPANICTTIYLRESLAYNSAIRISHQQKI